MPDIQEESKCFEFSVQILHPPPDLFLYIFTYGNNPEIFSITGHNGKCSGIPERFFPVNRKFLKPCSAITERYVILFRKIPVYGTIVPEFSGKVPKNIKDILEKINYPEINPIYIILECAPGFAVVKLILLWKGRRRYKANRLNSNFKITF